MKAIQTRWDDKRRCMVATDGDGNRTILPEGDGSPHGDLHRAAATAMIMEKGWAPVAVASGVLGPGTHVHVMMSPELPDQRSRSQYWMVTRNGGKGPAPATVKDTEDMSVYGL